MEAKTTCRTDKQQQQRNQTQLQQFEVKKLHQESFRKYGTTSVSGGKLNITTPETPETPETESMTVS